jgi:CHAT domain-containing protein
MKNFVLLILTSLLLSCTGIKKLSIEEQEINTLLSNHSLDKAIIIFEKDDGFGSNASKYYKHITPRLCYKAYHKRKYDFFFKCEPFFRKAMDRNDTKRSFTISPLDNLYFNYKSLNVLLNVFKTNVAIEFGDYELANSTILNARKIQESNNHESNTNVAYSRYNSPKLYVEGGLIHAEGLVYAAKNNYEKVDYKIQQLVKVGHYQQSTINKKSHYKQELIHRVLSLYMAKKDYAGAFKYLASSSKDDLSFGDIFSSLMGGGVPLLGLIVTPITVVSAYSYDSTMLNYLELKLKFENKKSDDLVSMYEKLLENKDFQLIPNLYFSALHDRARLSLSDNDLTTASFYLKESIKEIEKNRSTISLEATKIGYFANKQKVYSDLVAVLLRQNNISEAYENVEKAKSRALVDVLASKKQFGNQSTKKSNRLLAELDQVELESLQLASNTNRTRSVEIQKNMEATDKQLSSLISVKSTTASEIQSKLKKNEVLVEYYGNNENYFIFILTKNSIKSVKINSSNLESLVTNYRAALSTRDSKKYKSASKTLYNTVIKPVKHLIKGKKLTVVPHGSLHYVPFASLWDGKRYLVQNYQIRILPSASVLEFLQKKVENKAGNLLILGNPDLGDPQYDLPAAQEESLRLAKRVKGSKVLLRKKATETALKKYGSSFKNIHFAMHGLFEAEKPLTSGLFLAPDSENDGRLTVSELYDLDLNADLVTLSACETALGETKSGDDVIGFTRGFLYAGANSIVSSLWEVDDIATRDLMLRFYKELKSNNKARALQKAQLRVMKKYPHPYYWAAFQLTGQY